jgi:signal transduction histidine kinase
MTRARGTTLLVAAIAVAGLAGTAAVGAAGGMKAPDLRHLLIEVGLAAAVTALAVAFLMPLLARTSLRGRFVAVSLVASVAALVNVGVLTMAMAVSERDAVLVLTLLVYATAVAAAGGLVVARRSADAVRRLEETSGRWATGDLEARIGALDAGPELDGLARTLDAMATDVQRANARERELEETRRDLVTTLSHDLRTPLASLKAMIEAVEDGVVSDPSVVERYVREMRRSTDQLAAMVSDLFELAQLDAGAIEVEQTRARLGEVVQDAVATIRTQAEAKGLSLFTELGPASAADCSPRLERVLQNLLVNAVRHTPADGTVRVTAQVADGRLEVAVEDTGEGIAADQLPHVFDPFFRGDPSRRGARSGLGLALAKRIVEALGGTISAQSEPSAGSRFAVDVPTAAGSSLTI